MSANPIFVSQGDVAGIGWELLLNIISKKKISPAIEKNIVVVGDFFSVDKKYKKLFNIIDWSDNLNLQNYRGKKPRFIVLRHGNNYTAGKPSAALALRSYTAFQKTIRLWEKTERASLVTLPVSKEYISKAGIPFQGHTEVLEQTQKTKTLMCMYHSKLSVILLTNHIPLAKVPKKIPLINAHELAKPLQFFHSLFNIKKPMALCGLNPHAGENGAIGTEERHLKKLKKDLEANGVSIQGPLPADGLFSPHTRANYSGILANYHDQGLAPFKALFGLKGLNITLGLPRLRVSPDHGTAYDIAGKSIADDVGVEKAILFAEKWSSKWAQAYSSL